MFYLLLAILSSTMVSIVMKLSTNKISGNISMLAMNYMMCLCIAGINTGVGTLFPVVKELPLTLFLGTIHGILYLTSFMLLQYNIKKNGVVLSATFMKLGLLVPMVVSIVLFKEIPSFIQVIGFVIAILGILLINQEEHTSSMMINTSLVLLLLLGGAGDAMSKIYEEFGSAELSAQFLFYTFLVALLLCIGLSIFKKEKLGKNEVIYGLLIGIPNYFSAHFLLLSLKYVPAVIAYPTYSVATLLVVTLAGVGFFKERLSQKQWGALGIIVIALALLNL